MSEGAIAAPPAQPPETQSDNVVLLRDATWADYQRLLEIRGEKSVPRLAYLEGTVEIMSPSHFHEAIKSMLGRLVEAWCVEKGVDITPFGSWTLEDKEAERGVEPDECYVLGSADPMPERPDLAIEVVWTSGGLDKLQLYRKLGVRELWFWRREKLELFRLRDQQYEPILASEVLPGIDHTMLLRHVGTRPMTKAVREFVAEVRAAGA